MEKPIITPCHREAFGGPACYRWSGGASSLAICDSEPSQLNILLTTELVALRAKVERLRLAGAEQNEAIEKARTDAAMKAKREAEAKAAAEKKAKQAAEAKALAEMKAKEKSEADAKANKEAEPAEEK